MIDENDYAKYYGHFKTCVSSFMVLPGHKALVLEMAKFVKSQIYLNLSPSFNKPDCEVPKKIYSSMVCSDIPIEEYTARLRSFRSNKRHEN